VVGVSGWLALRSGKIGVSQQISTAAKKTKNAAGTESKPGRRRSRN
jgi:hypothetical protein